MPAWGVGSVCLAPLHLNQQHMLLPTVICCVVGGAEVALHSSKKSPFYTYEHEGDCRLNTWAQARSVSRVSKEEVL